MLNWLQIKLEVKISSLLSISQCHVFHFRVSYILYTTIKTWSANCWIKWFFPRQLECPLKILWQRFKLSHRDSHVLAEQKKHQRVRYCAESIAACNNYNWVKYAWAYESFLFSDSCSSGGDARVYEWQSRCTSECLKIHRKTTMIYSL